jgi:hypothetical protein
MLEARLRVPNPKVDTRFKGVDAQADVHRRRRDDADGRARTKAEAMQCSVGK